MWDSDKILVKIFIITENKTPFFGWKRFFLYMNISFFSLKQRTSKRTHINIIKFYVNLCWKYEIIPRLSLRFHLITYEVNVKGFCRLFHFSIVLLYNLTLFSSLISLSYVNIHSFISVSVIINFFNPFSRTIKNI